MFSSAEEMMIVNIFGLRDFRAGRQPIRDKTGKRAGELILHTFWFIETDRFSYPGNRGHVITGVVHTSEWTKGLILLPKQFNNSDNFEIKNPYTIELFDWVDPVLIALKSINLVYDDNIFNIGSGAFSYTLTIGTTKLFTRFELSNGPTNDTSLERLWNSVQSAIQYLVEQYDDKGMRQFIAPPKLTFD